MPPRPRWLSESGPDNDVVLSTRCRIARNLAGMPFPWRAGELDRKTAAETLLHAAHRAGGELTTAVRIRGDSLAQRDAERLQEWRYASRDWLCGGIHRWLVVGTDGILSAMINEEDCLRLQAVLPGLEVETVCEGVSDVARRMGESVEFARSDRAGFLTASLANAGTGMRISALLHLPGLAASGLSNGTLDAARRMGCSIRGLYGEGTEGTGELFQVSNSLSSNLNERQIADRVAASARYLMHAERRARRALFDDSAGRSRLRSAVENAIRDLANDSAGPKRLIPIVSILRLGIAEGLLGGNLADTGDWISLAGVAVAIDGRIDPAAERFETIQRSAALRIRLREAIRNQELSRPDTAE